jgi:hypothetical protein
MSDLLRIAPEINSPISLMALFTIVLLIIYKAIIKSNFFPIFTQKAGAEIIQNIVNKVFWLLISLIAFIYVAPIVNAALNTDQKKLSCYGEIEKTLDVGTSSSIFDEKYRILITQADELVCTLKINNQTIEVNETEPSFIEFEGCNYSITRTNYNSSKNACSIKIEPRVK